MALGPVTDYSSRDFASLVESLLDRAAVRLPEWTDRSENDLGRQLIELFAYVGDVILYYQDRVANEAFLATAVERRSVIDLLALIGYPLATPVAAEVELELKPTTDATVVVEVGARFSTQASAGRPAVEFRYLPRTEAPLTVVPQARLDDTFAPIRFSVLNAVDATAAPLGTSDGEANQGIELPARPVVLARDPDGWDGLVVEVQSGGVWQRWRRRQTLLDSLSGDPHFIVRIDENDAAEIVFGDGTFGRIPPADAPIRARYLTGGGAAGNVGPNTVVVAPDVNVAATVTNPKGASGGADRESIEHARRYAPGVFRSQQRAVTAADFAALAASYPGVARAVAVAPRPDRTVPALPAAAGETDPRLVTWNYIDLIVVAEGGLELTDTLRAGLLQFFDRRRMVTTIVSVRQPVFVSIDLTILVGIEPIAYVADVEQRVREAVDALFAIERADFGIPVYLSKVFEAIESVEGVAYAEVPVFRGRRSYPVDEPVDAMGAAAGRIGLRPREFPRRGKITVTTTGGLA